jgi:hypothetical protein
MFLQHPDSSSGTLFFAHFEGVNGVYILFKPFFRRNTEGVLCGLQDIT